MVPVRGTELVLGVTENVTVPLPTAGPAGEFTVIQPGAVGVHGHVVVPPPLPAVTLKDPFVPAAGAWRKLVLIEYAHALANDAG